MVEQVFAVSAAERGGMRAEDSVLMVLRDMRQRLVRYPALADVRSKISIRAQLQLQESLWFRQHLGRNPVLTCVRSGGKITLSNFEDWRRERDCSQLGTAARPSLRSGSHFVRPDLLCKSVEPNFFHVRGFESRPRHRELITTSYVAYSR
jgi:hypothetical protein